MTQRRLDGVKQHPPAKPLEPACVDCDITEDDGSVTWPDGKVLRKYGNEYACSPCSNGTAEPVNPIEEVRKAIEKSRVEPAGVYNEKCKPRFNIIDAVHDEVEILPDSVDHQKVIDAVRRQIFQGSFAGPNLQNIPPRDTATEARMKMREFARAYRMSAPKMDALFPHIPLP